MFLNYATHNLPGDNTTHALCACHRWIGDLIQEEHRWRTQFGFGSAWCGNQVMKLFLGWVFLSWIVVDWVLVFKLQNYKIQWRKKCDLSHLHSSKTHRPWNHWFSFKVCSFVSFVGDRKVVNFLHSSWYFRNWEIILCKEQFVLRGLTLFPYSDHLRSLVIGTAHL